MILTVISGLSGSGKTIALHTLEDLGFYCIDNLPVALLKEFALLMNRDSDTTLDRVAVGIDARNHAQDLTLLPAALHDLADQNIKVQLVYLEADQDTLLKRFSETRRRHPLSHEGHPLAEAIDEERKLLAQIAVGADLRVDTTHTTVHQLRDLIKERVSPANDSGLSLLIQSFGFKHGVPGDVDFVFDVRCLPNPYWEPKLRPLTGKDDAVAAFLSAQPLVQEMIDDLSTFLNRWLTHFESENRSYLTVAIGCTGGQHRSVFIAEALARYFETNRDHILTRHRELI